LRCIWSRLAIRTASSSASQAPATVHSEKLAIDRAPFAEFVRQIAPRRPVLAIQKIRPSHWNPALVDLSVAVSDDEAGEWRRRLAREKGLYVAYSALGSSNALQMTGTNSNYNYNHRLQPFLRGSRQPSTDAPRSSRGTENLGDSAGADGAKQMVRNRRCFFRAGARK
jgi:hypothetical protein